MERETLCNMYFPILFNAFIQISCHGPQTDWHAEGDVENCERLMRDYWARLKWVIVSIDNNKGEYTLASKM